MIRFAISLMFVVFGVSAGVLGFWAQDRKIPVTRTAQVKVIGDVHPGGKLLLQWEVVRARSCASTKQEVVIDIAGVRWILPQQVRLLSSPGPVGVPDKFVTQTELPEDIPPGAARLRVVLTYVCNPLHNLAPIIDEVPTVPFLISAAQ